MYACVPSVYSHAIYTDLMSWNKYACHITNMSNILHMCAKTQTNAISVDMYVPAPNMSPKSHICQLHHVHI